MSKTLTLLVLFVAALALATSTAPSVYVVQVNLDPTTLTELYRSSPFRLEVKWIAEVVLVINFSHLQVRHETDRPDCPAGPAGLLELGVGLHRHALRPQLPRVE